jgi:CMP-N-acetylneuraminic acid synthetase
MNIIAFIPAKGSSSRIPRKNLQPVGGIPLFLRACLHLRQVLPAKSIVVDSDADEILELAGSHGFGTLKRPDELATNATDGNAFFRWETSNYPDADLYLQHLPPMPFLAKATLERAIALATSTEFDSIVPVGRMHPYLWDAITGKARYDHAKLPNSFELPELVFETMGLYAIRGNVHRVTGRRIGDKPAFLDLSRIEQIDIDYPEDLELANAVANGLPSDSPFSLVMPSDRRTV